MENSENSSMVDLLNEDTEEYNYYSSTQQSESQQQTQYPFEDDQIEQEDDAGENGKPRGKSYVLEEDKLLVFTWLNTTLDAIVANNQNRNNYWERICLLFHKKKKFESDRTSKSLMNRWSVLQQRINKYSSFYSQVCENRKSRGSEEIWIDEAQEMYKNFQKGKEKGKEFQHVECWKVVRRYPKWLLEGQARKVQPPSKKFRTPTSNTRTSTPFDAYTPTTILDDEHPVPQNIADLERPSGKKMEKEHRQKGKGKDFAEDGEFVQILKGIREDKLVAEPKKLELLERKVIADAIKSIAKQKQVELQKQQLEMQQRLEDEKILSVDIANKDEVSAAYYKRRKMEIINKGTQGSQP
ncbi:hypothetical protein GIB67_028802 [Kingdonia uniflora]|uniref:No apical meristem-associated C-terminal domain-containing protein n=1 Tax=Kingdonia uniflora TaxID=39325 RepID=A0A7J7LBP7_9MAGN|nr:hypothetical protein GIB67_028802 [Kingdonia uniflora]